MIKIFLILILILTASPLGPAYHVCYVPEYPCVIMETESYRYVLERPGGKITKEEKDNA